MLITGAQLAGEGLMFGRLVSLGLVIFLAGCPAVRSDNGSDLKFLLVLNSIETSRAALAYSKMNALRDGDSNKCIATSVASDVLAAASDSIRNNLKEIPPLKVDVGTCLSFADDAEPTEERDAALLILIGSETKSSLDTAQFYFESARKNTEDSEVCKNSARALAVIKYLRPLPVIIVNDLQNTDGKLEIPGQPIAEPDC